MVGFDGSPVDGQQNIEEHLSEVFGSHPTAAYIGKVREVRLLFPPRSSCQPLPGWSRRASRS